GHAAEREEALPPEESERITIEINSSDIVEVAPAVAPPVIPPIASPVVPADEHQLGSDSAPTERRPSIAQQASRPTMQMTRSLQLAPTSIVPRASSDPAFVLSPPVLVSSNTGPSARAPEVVSAVPAATLPDPPEAAPPAPEPIPAPEPML